MGSGDAGKRREIHVISVDAGVRGVFEDRRVEDLHRDGGDVIGFRLLF